MSEIELPEIFEIDSGNAGLHLVVTGGVHGNEPCGVLAVQRILQEIEQGIITIEHGKVSFVPVCNPRARAQNIRQTERNLNRMMFPKSDPKAYEDHLDNVLCPLFDTADVLLDLHSCHSQSPPFIFLGPQTQENAEYARVLGVSHYVHGFAEALGDATADIDPKFAMGTTEYTRAQGGMALTLECGSHRDDTAPEVGYQAILRVLRYLGLAQVDQALIREQQNTEQHCIRMTQAFIKEEEGQFAKELQNFTTVQAGEILATYESGKSIIAPADGYIILPKEHETVGEEWFSFGTASDYFESALKTEV
jgi:predicted deacylase